jgi:F-type H+-transporting ATPase subunit gamma
MPTARDIKKRIRSVKNISQITRALESLSASRVRKAQARVLASRAFAEKAWEILLNVQKTGSKGTPLHPLLTARSEIKSVMIVLVTSNRGLAGAFNGNIIRVAVRFADRLGVPVKWVAVGKKGRDSLIRLGANVVAEFTNIKDDATIADITPVARLAIDEFLGGGVDDVFIAYTDFINTLSQRPVVLSWLPLLPFSTEDNMLKESLKGIPDVSEGKADYEYEPDPQAILDEIVPRFTELQLYQALLESQASEHSARMVAMRNASDNSAQLMSDLTLVYNKARQASITAEILDIVGGAEALQASMDKLADEVLAAQVRSNGNHAAAVAPVAPVAPRARKPKNAGDADDLKVMEGIGPKMEAALHAAGIDTYEKLSAASLDSLKQAVDAAGLLRMAQNNGIETWSQQSEYAVREDWDGLEALQAKLNRGRE